jgi:hypothetical protein
MLLSNQTASSCWAACWCCCGKANNVQYILLTAGVLTLAISACHLQRNTLRCKHAHAALHGRYIHKAWAAIFHMQTALSRKVQKLSCMRACVQKEHLSQAFVSAGQTMTPHDIARHSTAHTTRKPRTAPAVTCIRDHIMPTT